jgi:hypothetical protein
LPLFRASKYKLFVWPFSWGSNIFELLNVYPSILSQGYHIKDHWRFIKISSSL